MNVLKGRWRIMYKKGEDRSTTDKTVDRHSDTETAYGWNGGGGSQRTHPPISIIHPTHAMSYLGIADKGP